MQNWFITLFKNKLLQLLALALFSALFAFNTQAQEVNNVLTIRSSNKVDNSARVVLETSSIPDYNIFILSNPERIVADIKNAEWKINSNDIQTTKTVKSVRTGSPDSTKLRVVLDLDSRAIIQKHFVIKPDSSHPNYRLVIDVNFPDLAEATAVSEAATTTKTTIDKPAVTTTAKIDESLPVPTQKPSEEQIDLDSKIDEILALDNTDLGVVDEVNTDTPTAEEVDETTTEVATISSMDTSGYDSLIAKIDEDESLKVTSPIIKQQSSALESIDPLLKPKGKITPAQKTAIPYVSQAREAKSRTQKRNEKPVIVIDAGHGGKDPGAIGRRGTKEKYITLAYSKVLKEHLEKSGKYKVYLTRDKDFFIPLRGRVKKAREYKGDLFISIHANSSPNKKATGLSVYTLSENSSDKEAERLAASENKADMISGADLSGEMDDTIKILIDLARRDTLNSSSEFAEIAARELGKKVKTEKNTHRFAGFAVLTAQDTPSVLIELGFLSNKNEEKLLKTTDYRDKLTSTIARSVDIYFDKKGW